MLARIGPTPQVWTRVEAPTPQVGRGHHQRKGVELVLLDLAAQRGLRMLAALTRLRVGAFALEQLHRGHEPRAAGDPRGEAQDALATLGAGGEDQHVGLPVARSFGGLGQPLQAVLHPAETVRPAAVAPGGGDGGALQVLVHGAEQRQGHDPRQGIDRQHRPDAQQRPRQAGAPVEEAEARPKGGACAGGLDVGGVVQQAVGDQEEHRDHRGDRVQVARDDRRQRDCPDQEHAPARVALRPVAAREGRQQREHAVRRQRLQDARRPQKGRQRRGERRRHQPRIDQRGQRRHPAHGGVVAAQHVAGQRSGEDQHRADVHHGRQAHCGQGAARQAARGIAQIARHAHALGEAGDGGEEEREERPEAQRAGGRGQAAGQSLAVAEGEPAGEEGDEPGGEHRHDRVLEARGEVRAHECHAPEHERRPRGHQPRVRRREKGRRGLAEADAVERHRDGLGREDQQPQRTAVLDSQAAGDQVVVATAAHLSVGRDRSEREAGENRDRLGQRQDQQRPPEPRRADHEARAQEEDDAEDREHARREDTAEGSHRPGPAAPAHLPSPPVAA